MHFATDDDLTLGEVASAWSGWILLTTAIYLVLGLLSATLIARKAGYSQWLGVIAIAVPLVGPVLILLFALVKWPALRERDAAKALLAKNKLVLPADEKKAAAAAKQGSTDDA